MKRIILVCSISFLFATSVFSESYSLEEGRITFEAPAGFLPLSEELKKIKYPGARAPRYVVGNKGGGTSIAYDIKAHSVTQDQLEEVRQSFTKQFPLIVPGLVWKANKIIELAGRKWVLLELTSSAVDTNIHNIMLMTNYDGRMLMFNFNSTREEFKQYESALRKSIQSIQIKPAKTQAGSSRQKGSPGPSSSKAAGPGQ